MKFIDLMEIIQDEKRSEDFLRSNGILKTFTHCGNCGGEKLGLIRGDRWKCYSCKSEWTRRKDSILSLVRMKYSEFILCMKFFELELTAVETAAQLKINYKTVVQLFRNIRILIAGVDAIASVEKNVLGKETELFGIYKIGEEFHFDFSSTNKKNIAILRLKRKRISNSAAVLDVSSQIIKTTHTKEISRLPPTFQKFIRFTRENLFKFRGTDRRYLKLYLREIEFRFNNSRVDVFDCLGIEIAKNFQGWLDKTCV